jgi:fluoride exporter
MTPWVKLLALAAAGAAGTLARYGLSGLVQRASGAGFPWGTLAVNLAGCFLAGLIWSWAENRLALGGGWRAVVFIGFLGGFTTFSAYMLETGAMLGEAGWFRAMGNLLLHNGGGALALFAGTFLGKTL